MLKLRCFVIVGLCLSVILTACSPVAPAPTPIPSTPQPVLPSATSVPTSEPAGVGVPALEYKNGQNVLLVVSSVTGRVFDSYAPIQLGRQPAYSLSPDGRTLAVVSFVSDEYPANAQLYLIDLPSWKYRTTILGELRDWVNTMTFSSDGTVLAVSAGIRGELLIIDIKGSEVRASTQTGFSIRNVKFTTDGKAIMVYGPQFAQDVAISIGAPKASLYSVSDLSILWSVEIDGVRDGIFPKKEGTSTEDLFKPGVAVSYTPGVVFAPTRDLLYVVHGDEDKLTTVDFTSKKVKTVEVHAQLSWLDQLMALTAGVAYAKGMDGTNKQAVISQDGKTLYVVGSSDTFTQQQNGDLKQTITPLGLQIINTEDGALLEKYDTEATSAYASGDGRYVLLSGWKDDAYGTPWTEVYDMSSNSFVKRIDNVSLMPTYRMDGKIILVSSDTISNNVYYMAFIEPDTWTIARDWKGPDYVNWLIAP